LLANRSTLDELNKQSEDQSFSELLQDARIKLRKTQNYNKTDKQGTGAESIAESALQAVIT